MPTPARPPDDELLEPAAQAQGTVLFARLLKHMRLRQLQLLVALQQSGSVVKAAALLHMSQSAATQSLAEMERILGISLFDRHARGLRPTLAGHTLVDTARGILAALEESAESLAAIRRGARAALRLGTTPAASLSVLSPLLSEFYEKHADLHIDVHEDTGERLLPQLFKGGVDAVFCRKPALLPASFVFKALQEDRPVVIASIHHTLAGRPDLSLQALKDSRWVFPTAHLAVRDIFEREVLTALPDALRVPISTVSLAIFSRFLNKPDAVALMPQSVTPGMPLGSSLSQLSVQLKSPLAPLGVVFHKDQAPALLGQMLRRWRR
ncbi:LysR family transcriptional regulator [Bordetella holmesii]|uniref:LysR substrate-binding domain protein n=4 Tax=Bordetella holmesii TaxID=35814 RepID=A0A158M8C5_9BORD|nr:LysR family transcriptional regulator [Bordetella holmesii]AHV91152.1 bacterial regulatory helix-turn-helix, lysR family protein [Bordetella holmesii ATCC 51541]AIT26488.1 bacterial regulatory helix-turn-helix, lysR family protein [Bordetella holmesii 44057]EWM43763.1 bacterial regulatory helix-turn-helix, lysR family protein [Bordetella holmesii 41130]EWM47063.1 bacterial regulatory helix-turn-helix, lysR family protein [Bordetella holmesii 35009]AMD45491.1 LysR family transcriptional regu